MKSSPSSSRVERYAKKFFTVYLFPQKKYNLTRWRHPIYNFLVSKKLSSSPIFREYTGENGTFACAIMHVPHLGIPTLDHTTLETWSWKISMCHFHVPFLKKPDHFNRRHTFLSLVLLWSHSGLTIRKKDTEDRRHVIKSEVYFRFHFSYFRFFFPMINVLQFMQISRERT